MKCARVLGVPALLLVLATPLLAQGRWSARTAAIFESYRFDAPLVISRVSEFTLPIGLTYDFGQFGNLALSTGYAGVSLQSRDTLLGDQHVSGLLDTEARLSVNLVPGKLVGLVTGSVPTGIKTVQVEELSILGAISSDIVGFAASNLGTGGNVGAGFVGAVPLGSWAAGFGATFKQPMGYAPLLADPRQLKPGNEVRLRGGLEGAIARRTYVRLAGILVRTAKDHIARPAVDTLLATDSTKNGVGHRLISYVSVNQGIRSMSLTLYGFDVFRGAPQVEPTALGAAILFRGNLLALGGRLDVPLRQTTTLTPSVEWRTSASVPDSTTTALQSLGSSVRFGVDIRHRLTNAAALVLQGSGASGYVNQAGSRIDLSGYRIALHLELIK